MMKLPFSGWMLVLILLFGVFIGGKLVLLDLFRWGIHLVRLSAGVSLSVICSVCLIGIYKRKMIAKFAAIMVMIICAVVMTGISSFFLVVGQQEPDIMELARTGFIASFFLITFSIIFLLSKNLKKYFN